MRPGFSTKELAQLLGVHEHSATEAINPALRKVAKLWIANPVRFIETLLPFLAEADQAAFEQHELPVREAMAEGRINRASLQRVRR